MYENNLHGSRIPNLHHKQAFSKSILKRFNVILSILETRLYSFQEIISNDHTIFPFLSVHTYCLPCGVNMSNPLPPLGDLSPCTTSLAALIQSLTPTPVKLLPATLSVPAKSLVNKDPASDMRCSCPTVYCGMQFLCKPTRIARGVWVMPKWRFTVAWAMRAPSS